MKKLIVTIYTALILASCSVYKHPYTTFVTAIDFSEYTNNGFFITESNSVSFEYDPVSSVMAHAESGHEVLGKEDHESYDIVYGKYTKVRYGNYIRATAQQAIEELYQTAINMGADGVINLKIIYTPYSSYDGNVISFESYYVSGMAIRRK